MESLNTKFLKEISKIKEPEVFIGLAKVLGVKLLGEEKDENGKFIPRDFTEVLDDVMKSFDGARRSRKGELLRLLAEANKAKG